MRRFRTEKLQLQGQAHLDHLNLEENLLHARRARGPPQEMMMLLLVCIVELEACTLQLANTLTGVKELAVQ